MLLINNRVIGGVLLVSGTTIGAAMLALPPVTGLAGFYPSATLFFIYWAFFAFTAFLMLEVTLWMEEDTNLITMARRTLGIGGEALSWVTYLFLLYSLTTAYLAGSSSIVLNTIHTFTGYTMPSWFGPLPLLFIFGFFVYRGAKFVDVANRVFMLGLTFTYCATVYLLFPHVQSSNLNYSDPQFLLISNSVLATSFGFHIIIPSLATYLKRNVRQLRLTILIGSSIPLVVYLIWEWVSLGVIPLEGRYGIIQGYEEGANGAYLLGGLLGNSSISMLLRLFAFFSIVTSFLGVSLSLRDFLADGFKIEKTHKGKIKLYLMTFAPTLLFMWTYPRAFLSALEYAGAFGVMILLGFLPAVMVWRGRYSQGLPTKFRTPGGKVALIIVMVFSSLVVFLEIANKLGFTDFIINVLKV
ncbi:MAG: aromatic amino acid transport family protein [Chlamydiota bacterium]|nr:aromatic amino acid transport family protein [Chlamydiota bacterium]